ncbi:MAG: hypothetical protein BGO55_07320 [Sphingobacteriales bacterium 50-39]|nr:NYN domain-containing protein [Sphingobacteriales bacterium]OJW53056.1 MAG: hypothetical protein BGO55_07320 [Sphingobacteriales bacterium 50-39]
MRPTVAILIDGGFFLKRYYDLYNGAETHNAQTIARNICRAAMKHVPANYDLYRIFYYDCSPLGKRVHNPVTGKCIDLARSDLYKLRLELFEKLKKKRKVALRLGRIKDTGSWQIYPSKVKALLKGEITVNDIKEGDVFYEMRQKGIDMKIGVDIASLSLKKQVNQIVLISGDEDFVPASKLARREGIDFILDPLWNHIDANLFEHIDGLNSTSPRPAGKQARN